MFADDVRQPLHGPQQRSRNPIGPGELVGNPSHHRIGVAVPEEADNEEPILRVEPQGVGQRAAQIAGPHDQGRLGDETSRPRGSDQEVDRPADD